MRTHGYTPKIALAVCVALLMVAFVYIIVDGITWGTRSTVTGVVRRDYNIWILDHRPFNLRLKLLSASIEGLPTDLQREGTKVTCSIIERKQDDEVVGLDFHFLVNDCTKM